MGERAPRSIRQIQRAKSPAELKLPRRTTADFLRSLLADLLKHERVEVGREEGSAWPSPPEHTSSPEPAGAAAGHLYEGKPEERGREWRSSALIRGKGSEEYGGSLEVQADAEQRRVGGRAPEVTVYLCFHVYAYFHSSIILPSCSSVSKK